MAAVLGFFWILTRFLNVERQPVHEGVADQLGEEQTQGKLYHSGYE